jgi:phosphate acetyltransferase
MLFKNDFIGSVTKRAIRASQAAKIVIAYAEVEPSILKAASIVKAKGIAHPLIVGSESRILELSKNLGIKNLDKSNIWDHLSDKSKGDIEDFAKIYMDMRLKDGKKLSAQDAMEKIKQPHFFAAMLVHKDLANGMICGINSATKPYYPAFEIIKTREGISRASGLFVMVNGKYTYFFADCALNINPTAEQLAEIALTANDSVINFGFKPRIAMLSFSTRDSAKHEMVDKVKNATRMVREKDKEILIDGEIQLDAAIVPEVYEKKCSDSPLEGNANVLIFPDLNSGNIGYKLVQRLAGYKAIGPIMQGLNKPINDLSRGASVQDIVDLTAITVVQGL